MAFETRFDEDNRILWIILEGVVDPVEMIHTVRSAFRSDVFNRRIWDIRRMTNSVSPAKLAAIAAAVGRVQEEQPVRSAILTATDMQFGVGRAMQPRVDSSIIALGVFRDEQEAVDWVTQEPEQKGLRIV